MELIYFNTYTTQAILLPSCTESIPKPFLDC